MNSEDQKMLYPLLQEKNIFIFGGLGGVGKTTSSAAFGWSLAELGAKVLVVTVDPAKRLLDTFGSSVLQTDNPTMSNDPVRISALPQNQISLGDKGGELWVSMLDTKVSFDNLIYRICENKTQSEMIIANDIYRNISSGFAYGSEYIAMERVLYLSEQTIWDYIIVDTPPGENLFKLLAAPQRMVQFFSSKTLRVLIAPYRSKVLNLASKPLYEIANRLLGLEMLAKIGEFFKLFEPVRIKFLKRSEEVEAMLKDARTTHFLVTALDVLRSAEIKRFIGSFVESEYNLDAIICNLSLPGYLGNNANKDLASFLGELAISLVENRGQAGKIDLETDDQKVDSFQFHHKIPSAERITSSTEGNEYHVAADNGLLEQSFGIQLYDNKNNNPQTAEEKSILPSAISDVESEIVLSELLKSMGNNFGNLSLVEADQSMLYREILDLADSAYPPGQNDKRGAKIRIIRLPYITVGSDEIEKIAHLGKAILEGLE